MYQPTFCWRLWHLLWHLFVLLPWFLDLFLFRFFFLILVCFWFLALFLFLVFGFVFFLYFFVFSIWVCFGFVFLICMFFVCFLFFNFSGKKGRYGRVTFLNPRVLYICTHEYLLTSRDIIFGCQIPKIQYATLSVWGCWQHTTSVSLKYIEKNELSKTQKHGNT